VLIRISSSAYVRMPQRMSSMNLRSIVRVPPVAWTIPRSNYLANQISQQRSELQIGPLAVRPNCRRP
jgi:hypothetical protein